MGEGFLLGWTMGTTVTWYVTTNQHQTKMQSRNGSSGPSLRLNKISRWHCCTLDSGAENNWLRLQDGQGSGSFITLVRKGMQRFKHMYADGFDYLFSEPCVMGLP